MESRKQTGAAEYQILTQKLAKIDDLYKQLVNRNRPLSQAIDRSLNLAFVPYSQMDGVHPGASVFHCRWGWGMFGCREVGTVTDVLAGEVVQPDPWGTMGRGQFVALTLRDPQAAKVKALRIRDVRSE